MNEKQDIILKFLREGLSQREISRRTGIARDTIRKYIRYYEDKLKKLGYELNEIDKVNFIEDIVEPPKYNSSPRIKTAVTDEVIEKLEAFLKESENKRLTGFSKQQMKKIDMYEALIEEGFNVSYSSVASAVNKLDEKKKEAFIRQEYLPGDVLEFDFGTVKLFMDGNSNPKEYQLAVFTAAYSNYRWARLFPKQNTACFLESHAYFLKK